MAYVDLIGHFCCSRYLYMNAKNRKVIDANILPMTQRPLQKVTYKTRKLAKDEKKKQSEQSRAHSTARKHSLKVNNHRLFKFMTGFFCTVLNFKMTLQNSFQVCIEIF